MDKSKISDLPDSFVLSCMGIALLQVKCERNLTLPDMGRKLGRTRQQVAAYIAGEHEMGALMWERAKEAWPELSSKFVDQLGLNGKQERKLR